MNVKFHKNCENTGNILKVLFYFRCNFVNLTVIFSGTHKKFSLVYVTTDDLITSLALEKCKKECNIL